LAPLRLAECGAHCRFAGVRADQMTLAEIVQNNLEDFKQFEKKIVEFLRNR
jgi:hypothetical protein